MAVLQIRDDLTAEQREDRANEADGRVSYRASAHDGMGRAVGGERRLK